MVVLGLDTATAHASVAVLADGSVRAEQGTTTRNHAATVPMLIDATLAEAGIRPRDIDLVAVAAGPGSFTGLRVGLSTAKGFAYAVGAKLVGVSTLEALAHTVDSPDAFVVVLLDARKGEVYTAQFARAAATGCRRITEDTLTSLEHALAAVPRRAVIVGDAERAHAEQIRQVCGPDVEILPFASHGPRGSAVARVGAAQPATADPLALEPIYLRPPDAERNTITA